MLIYVLTLPLYNSGTRYYSPQVLQFFLCSMNSHLKGSSISHYFELLLRTPLPLLYWGYGPASPPVITRMTRVGSMLNSQ